MPLPLPMVVAPLSITSVIYPPNNCIIYAGQTITYGVYLSNADNYIIDPLLFEYDWQAVNFSTKDLPAFVAISNRNNGFVDVNVAAAGNTGGSFELSVSVTPRAGTAVPFNSITGPITIGITAAETPTAPSQTNPSILTLYPSSPFNLSPGQELTLLPILLGSNDVIIDHSLFQLPAPTLSPDITTDATIEIIQNAASSQSNDFYYFVSSVEATTAATVAITLNVSSTPYVSTSSQPFVFNINAYTGASPPSLITIGSVGPAAMSFNAAGNVILTGTFGNSVPTKVVCAGNDYTFFPLSIASNLVLYWYPNGTTQPSVISPDVNYYDMPLMEAWGSYTYDLLVKLFSIGAPDSPLMSVGATYLAPTSPTFTLNGPSQAIDFDEIAYATAVPDIYSNGDPGPDPSLFTWSWTYNGTSDPTVTTNTYQLPSQLTWGDNLSVGTGAVPIGNSANSMPIQTFGFSINPPELIITPNMNLYMHPNTSLPLSSQIRDSANNSVNLGDYGTVSYIWLSTDTSGAPGGGTFIDATLANPTLQVGATLGNFITTSNATYTPSNPLYGTGELTASIPYTISADIPSLAVSSTSLYMGQSAILTVTMVDGDNNPVDLSGYSWSINVNDPIYMGDSDSKSPAKSPAKKKTEGGVGPKVEPIGIVVQRSDTSNIFDFYAVYADVGSVTITLADPVTGIAYSVYTNITVNTINVIIAPGIVTVKPGRQVTLNALLYDETYTIQIDPSTLVGPLTWQWQWVADDPSGGGVPPNNLSFSFTVPDNILSTLPDNDNCYIGLTLSNSYISLSDDAPSDVIVSSTTLQIPNRGQPISGGQSTLIVADLGATLDPSDFVWSWNIIGDSTLATLSMSSDYPAGNGILLAGNPDAAGTASVQLSVGDPNNLIYQPFSAPPPALDRSLDRLTALSIHTNPTASLNRSKIIPKVNGHGATIFQTQINIYVLPLAVIINPGNIQMLTAQTQVFTAEMINFNTLTALDPQPTMVWVWTCNDATLLSLTQTGIASCSAVSSTLSGIVVLVATAYDPSLLTDPSMVAYLAAIGVDPDDPNLASIVANLIAAGSAGIIAIINALVAAGQLTIYSSQTYVYVNHVICLGPLTPILMADGKQKPIYEIKRGDYVARNYYITGTNRVSRVNLQSFGPTTRLSLIQMAPNALGHRRPSHPLIITENHPIIYKCARRPAKCFRQLKGVTHFKNVRACDVLPISPTGYCDLYDLQFDYDSTYVASGLLVQSRSPYSELTPLPLQLYFNTIYYSSHRVWDTMDQSLPLKTRTLGRDNSKQSGDCPKMTRKKSSQHKSKQK